MRAAQSAEWARFLDQEGVLVVLGARVKQLRKERGWSQEELAEAVGAAGAHQISRYENGQTTPSTETVIKLAEVFDVSLDYLLIEGAARRALRNGDYSFLDRLGDVNELSEEERASVLLFVEALLARKRIKSLAAEVG